MNRLFLLAEAGGETFAIPAEAVDSVVPCEEIVAVPLAPSWIAGIAALRSRVITVIDVVAAIGGQPSPPGDDSAIIVISLDGHLYGLIVDSVDDVVESEKDVQPVGAAFEPGWQRVSSGMVEIGGRAVLAIEPSALVVQQPVAA